MPDPSTELRTGSLRLFVAIELPGEVREALGRLQHELQRRGLEQLRWVRPESIHLTLKFLGETPAEKVPAIGEALSEAVHGVGRFPLWLGYVDTFRGDRVPRVVWIGVNDSRRDFQTVVMNQQRLHNLQARVANALAAIGFPPEQRSFTGHLTLARVRHGTGPQIAPIIREVLNDRDSWDDIIAGAETEVREVSLMRSRLQPSGAMYERVAAFALGGG